MKRFFLLLSVVCFTWNETHTAFRPPGINVQPDHVVFYKAGEVVQLPCEALANPKAIYTWKLNGFDFVPSGNDDRIVQLPDVGTLEFRRPEDKDEGIFQCFAENFYGKSASVRTYLREARLKHVSNAYPRTYRPRLGAPLTLVCNAPESVPDAQISWAVQTQNGTITPIVLDARITVDHEDRLRYANIKPEDHNNGNPVLCLVINQITREMWHGEKKFISPQGTVEEQREVTYLWASPADNIGLHGDEFKLKCIFAGNPTPDVHWERVDGQPLPSHVQQVSFGQELVFEKLEFTDQGGYRCWAMNYLSPTSTERTVYVRVESRPYWTDQPKDVEVSTGSTAHFKCGADAVPKRDIFWFINAVPLSDVIDPRIDHRFSKVSDEEVVFVNVTAADDMVIQCNVTNKHGYIWGDVYLNVLCKSFLLHSLIVPVLR